MLKQRLSLLEATPAGGQKLADKIGRLWQQRAQAFTPSFTPHADKWGCLQVEVTGRQSEQFLNAGARVIKHAEENVIPFSVLGQPVDLRQQMIQFLLAHVAQKRAERFLGGNGQHGATQSCQRWLSSCGIAEEGLHGGQACISRASRVASAGFQISQKIQHQSSAEILEGELIHRTSTAHSGKLEQKLHRVPRGRGRMRANAPLDSGISKEESGKQSGELGHIHQRLSCWIK
jgi:hypothetical protein